MTPRIGLIVENKSDFAVIVAIVRKIKPTANVPFTPMIAHGCARIRAKSADWAKNLHSRGCSLLLVVHDCDKNDEHQLRQKLEATLSGCPITKRMVVIPVEELEAWLLADGRAIKNALGLKRELKKIASPHLIRSPKEYIGSLVFKLSGKTKRYLNTEHNERIAKMLNIIELRRCPSFPPFEAFVREHVR